jgi:predicted PurR-regulated permease PerM
VKPRVVRALFWIGLFLLVIVVLGLVQSILMPFVVGFALAYVLAPAVAHLQGWGVRRTLGSFLVLILFLLGLSLILVILVPLIQGQIIQLIASTPSIVAWSQSQLADLVELLEQRLPAEDVVRLRDMLGAKMAEAVTWLALLLQSLITSSLAILNILSLVIVTPIVAFFLLRDWEKMVAVIDSYLPRSSLDTVRGQARLVSDTLVGYFHGQALICLILAAYYAGALSIIGLASALAVGVLVGVLAIIPILGVTTGLILALGLAASQYGTWTAVIKVCAVFAVGQMAEANILTPKLLGDRVHLHPVWVIFALFAGGALFGFIGIVLAVPAAAVIGVLARFALSRYRDSTLYSGAPSETEPTVNVTRLR